MHGSSDLPGPHVAQAAVGARAHGPPGLLAEDQVPLGLSTSLARPTPVLGNQ